MLKRMMIFSMASMMILSLIGCGQTGPLRLPNQSDAQSTSSTPTTATTPCESKPCVSKSK